MRGYCDNRSRRGSRDDLGTPGPWLFPRNCSRQRSAQTVGREILGRRNKRLPGSRSSLQQFYHRSGRTVQSGVVRQRWVLCLRHNSIGAQLGRAANPTWAIGTTIERVGGRRLTDPFDGEINAQHSTELQIESSQDVGCANPLDYINGILRRPALFSAVQEKAMCFKVL